MRDESSDEVTKRRGRTNGRTDGRTDGLVDHGGLSFDCQRGQWTMDSGQ
jgi:phage protein D